MITKSIEQVIAEQATGLHDAGGYRQFAEENGYPYCSVIDWTSSAGDWTFIVSRDGKEWVFMSQENNYPRGPGFIRQIQDDLLDPRFYGDEDEAMEMACKYSEVLIMTDKQQGENQMIKTKELLRGFSKQDKDRLEQIANTLLGQKSIFVLLRHIARHGTLTSFSGLQAQVERASGNGYAVVLVTPSDTNWRDNGKKKIKRI